MHDWLFEFQRSIAKIVDAILRVKVRFGCTFFIYDLMKAGGWEVEPYD